jgi:hypothetical protein
MNSVVRGITAKKGDVDEKNFVIVIDYGLSDHDHVGRVGQTWTEYGACLLDEQ